MYNKPDSITGKKKKKKTSDVFEKEKTNLNCQQP